MQSCAIDLDVAIGKNCKTHMQSCAIDLRQRLFRCSHRKKMSVKLAKKLKICQWNLRKMVTRIFGQWKSGCTNDTIYVHNFFPLHFYMTAYRFGRYCFTSLLWQFTVEEGTKKNKNGLNLHSYSNAFYSGHQWTFEVAKMMLSWAQIYEAKHWKIAPESR